jgi:hypothetical protein
VKAAAVMQSRESRKILFAISLFAIYCEQRIYPDLYTHNHAEEFKMPIQENNVPNLIEYIIAADLVT